VVEIFKGETQGALSVIGDRLDTVEPLVTTLDSRVTAVEGPVTTLTAANLPSRVTALEAAPAKLSYFKVTSAPTTTDPVGIYYDDTVTGPVWFNTGVVVITLK
jgi:hypothetical protein